jgi:hypothetical protein
MRKRFTIAGLLLSLAITSLLPAAASAAGRSGSSLTTAPVSTVIHTTPGHPVSTTLSVEDDSLEPYKISLQVQTFRPYGDTGQAQIQKPKPNSAYVNWVHFSQNNFTIQPNVWQKITMTVDPPSTAGLDYYYAIIVKPAPLSSSSKPISLNGFNAVLVLLDVETPNAKAQLTVDSFSTSHRLYEYLPATFSIGVRNTGNIFLAPQGDIFISRTNNFSHIIDTIPINKAQGNVIPASDRVFSQQWTDGFPVFTPNMVDGEPVTVGNGVPVEHLSWNFNQSSNLRFGKYYAKMVFVYNNGAADIPTVAVVSFWVIPWKILSAIIIIVILCMVGMYVSGHKLAKKTIKAFKQPYKGRR